jgi:hypothetical protein
MTTVKTDLDPNEEATVQLKARATVQYRNLKQKANIANNEKPGLAYLLVREAGQSNFVLLPGSNPEIVRDFYELYEEMENCPEVQPALELAFSRMNEVLPEVEAVCAAADVGGKKSDSGGKLFGSLDDSKPLACAAMKPEPGEKKSSDVLSVHTSGYVPSAEEKGKSKKGKGASTKAAGAKKRVSSDEPPVDEKSKDETPQKEEQFSNKGRDLLQQVVEVNSSSKEVISPLKYSSDGDSLSIDDATRAEGQSSRVARHKPTADKNASWHDFFQGMKKDGWTHTTGDNLVSYYWVHPTHAHLSKRELLKQGELGRDYFASEEAVKRYAKREYGWQGEVESPVSNEQGRELVDRIKRSSRVQKASKTSDSYGSEYLPDMESKMSDKLESTLLTLCKNWTGGYCAVSTKTSEIMEFMASPIANVAHGIVQISLRELVSCTCVAVRELAR